jgi:ATP/maltotriose-dependent transcriptional regulator MalT
VPHLTCREIAEGQCVSRHTTTSQAIAIYCKLGVTSRSQAIGRMQDLGLLEHA